MGDKIKIPYITETVLIDGTYHQEQRSGEDRRKSKQKYPYYDRRKRIDPRIGWVKKINEEV
ncbi:hypothetical protein M1D72_16835 [Vibrio sp. AK197]|uniref:Transposase n=1 Tax=Vibrio olivae TaxID=1243002 RepID=A0ABV5HHK1_9VIBR